MTRGVVRHQNIAYDRGAGRWTPKKFYSAAQGKMKMTWENITYDQGGGRWTSPVVGLGEGG
jgi:hypothetical protein